MKIAIIGGGNVGTALAGAWTRAGHTVVLGLRDTGKGGAFEALEPRAAAEEADAVVLAVPYGAVAEVAAAIGPLSGKIVIDATNPIARTDHGPDLAIGFASSGGEELQRLLPQARVIKTLNQIGAEGMADASGFAHQPAMFMAGDDEEAKRTVAGLLADIGFEPLDAGPLHRARLLEPFAMVWINQALMRGKGRDWAFAALPRS